MTYHPDFEMADSSTAPLSSYFHKLISSRTTLVTIMYSFPKGTLLLLLLLLINSLCWSQDVRQTDSLKTINRLDSLFIDRDLNNWSIRLFGNIKAQGFRLSNDNVRLSYTPNDLYGIGVGVATSKLILDFTYNLKNRNTENTDRFDLRGGLILEQNIIDFYFQVYRGFNIKNSINSSSIFRDDIKSIAGGVDYLYLFNTDGYSQTSLNAGLSAKKWNIFSFGLGGFILYNQISAEQSIVPEEFIPDFNEQARITNLTNYGIGIMGGVVSLFKLPANFYIALGAKAGLGLTIKNAEAETVSYSSKNPMVYKLNGSALFGYKWNRFYTTISLVTSTDMSYVGYGNKGAFTLLSGKLALGYRIKSNKKSI